VMLCLIAAESSTTNIFVAIRRTSKSEIVA
jgi:hypothetical protein